MKQPVKDALYNTMKDNLTTEPYTFEADTGFCRQNKETRAFKRFTGKTAIVTGAQGNFGSECARRLAYEGASVILWDIVPTTGLQDELRVAYPDQYFSAFNVDITIEDQITNACEHIRQTNKQVSLLFNNAGYQGEFTPTIDYPVDDFKKIMDINVNGSFIVMKAVANLMKKNNLGGCSIVNTASMAGIGAPPNMIAYSASKAAVKHMTVIAAKDLAPLNIRVNSISPAYIGPGFMWTRQVELQAKSGSIYFNKEPRKVAEQMVNSVPMHRYGAIDEVIGPVLFLLSDDASYITGEDIKITGGE